MLSKSRFDVEDEGEVEEDREVSSLRERLDRCGRGTVICRQRYEMNEKDKAVEKFDFVTAIATELWHVQRKYGTKDKGIYLKRPEMLDLVEQAEEVEAAKEPERIAAFDEWNEMADPP